jgi:hypothetical protein
MVSLAPVFVIVALSEAHELPTGTSPGPAIYLREDQPTWVRVYNDLESKNTTIVLTNLL